MGRVLAVILTFDVERPFPFKRSVFHFRIRDDGFELYGFVVAFACWELLFRNSERGNNPLKGDAPLLGELATFLAVVDDGSSADCDCRFCSAISSL